MKKIWQVISKKDFIFGILILTLVILFSFRPSNKIRVTFGADSVDIKTTKYAMNIPYEIIDNIELVDKPEMGVKLDGYTDDIIQTGVWINDAFGEYTSCMEVATDNCIVIHLDDGRLFVISRRNNEETTRVYEEFLTYLK